MGLTDELQKLDALHRSGALTADEFRRAKEALLSAGGRDGEPQMDDAIRRLQRQIDLLRLDQDWETERRKYLDWYGKPPGDARMIFLVLMLMVAGIVMFVIDADSSGHTEAVRPAFLGALSMMGATAFGLFETKRAGDYEAAHRRHQERRRELTEETD